MLHLQIAKYLVNDSYKLKIDLRNLNLIVDASF